MVIVLICVLGLLSYFIYRHIFRKEIKNEYNWPDEKNLFERDFLDVIENYSRYRYFVVIFDYYFDYYYVQYMSMPESNDLYVESISNENLIENKKIDPLNLNKLLSLNFLPPNKVQENGHSTLNFSKKYSLKNKSDCPQVFEDLVEILEKIYHIQNGSKINLNFS
tara:strand:+ start:15770 stop:16264 length:495 start_codon:yes stop_codon:yes gene_type:complete